MKCPDEFALGKTVVFGRARTKEDAEKILDKGIDTAVKELQDKHKCKDRICESGDACEPDYAVVRTPTTKVMLPTKKHGTKIRWIASADLFFGCFCKPADDPDDE